jgi:hypothetical protein
MGHSLLGAIFKPIRNWVLYHTCIGFYEPVHTNLCRKQGACSVSDIRHRILLSDNVDIGIGKLRRIRQRICYRTSAQF